MSKYSFIKILLLTLCLSSADLGIAQLDSLPQRIQLNGKEFIIHTVVKGNTLYSLSRQYDVSVDDIAKYNPEAKAGLNLGQTLKIPVPDQREEMKRKIELDGNYLVHEITSKQTLYSISKMYNVEIKDIVSENPNVVYGIKTGDLLKVPIDKIKKPAAKLTDVTKDRYPDHKVLPKETLYSISKKYNVSIEEIEDLNGGFPEGLKEGQIINVPLITEASFISDGFTPDSPMVKSQYNIALFLPLFIEMNDSIEGERRMDEEVEIYGGKNTAAALKFYQGVMLALDSAGRAGFKATLHVYDTENDTAKVNGILRSSKFSEMDLVIGPLYPKLFNLVLDKCEEQQINIVSPINPSNRPLLGHTTLIKIVTSKTTQVIDLARYLVDNYRQQNIVVLKKDFIDNSLADAFLNHYKDNLTLLADSNFKNAAREFSFNTSTKAEDLKTILQPDTQNILFLPSTDKVFVSGVIRKLNSLSKDYRITLIGMEEWLKYENIDLDYFNNLNLHVISWNYIDYQNESTAGFVRGYHRRYKSFPGEFGSKGYDISLYMFTLMMKYGNSLLNYIEKNPRSLSAHSFRFCQTGIESGFENQSLVILKFDDYKLRRVY